MKHLLSKALVPAMTTVLLAGSVGLGIAVAQPAPPPIQNQQEAIAAIDNAQAELDRVEAFLKTPTTPPTTTTPPPTTTTPAPVPTTEAAKLLNWGTPGAGTDEFNYTGAPNGALWSQAGQCWAGHAGNGKRCANRSTVDGNKLIQTGLANGDSAWLASKTEQRYGRWEARVRSAPEGANNGRQYHPLLIIWPTSNRWPQDGEYDFLENGAPGAPCAESFIHYPHNAGIATQQEFKREPAPCGTALTEWHNVAIDWQPTGIKGYIDGKEWFSYAGGANSQRQAIQAMPSGHLTIQLDNFFGGNMQPARYEVDWVRVYK